jgi:hypothetical protein
MREPRFGIVAQHGLHETALCCEVVVDGLLGDLQAIRDLIHRETGLTVTEQEAVCAADDVIVHRAEIGSIRHRYTIPGKKCNTQKLRSLYGSVKHVVVGFLGFFRLFSGEAQAADQLTR